ncbi:hypothetical protein Halar_0267 (plasmid) [halophilic archaeon DL31]|nr:hypothetical protein Halar_0267 [halophilic archaeon DL31]
MHATIDVRFELSIDDDKTIPLATLAEFVTDQNIESVLLEELVESLDAAPVEALCGQKHAHGNGDQRFQRASTDTRTAVTTAGEHEFTSTTSKTQPLNRTNTVTSGPSKMSSTLTARTAINGTSQPKTSISLFRSAIVMPLITARASSQGRIGMIHNQSSPVRVMRID